MPTLSPNALAALNHYAALAEDGRIAALGIAVVRSDQTIDWEVVDDADWFGVALVAATAFLARQAQDRAIGDAMDRMLRPERRADA